MKVQSEKFADGDGLILRSFSEIVDQSIRNRATSLGFRSGEWRDRVSDSAQVDQTISEIEGLIEETSLNQVLKLDGSLSQHGLVRLIDIVWDRRRSGVMGTSEAIFTELALKLEKLFKLVEKPPLEKTADMEKNSSTNPDSATDTPQSMVLKFQNLMDKHAKSDVKFRAYDLVRICNEEGVDPRLAFLMFWRESHWGTAGRAKRTFNPGNVGNTDSGAHRYMGRAGDDVGQRFLDGIRDWCRFMKQGYETTLEGFIESGGIRTKGGNIGASYARNNYSRALPP